MHLNLKKIDLKTFKFGIFLKENIKLIKDFALDIIKNSNRSINLIYKNIKKLLIIFQIKKIMENMKIKKNNKNFSNIKTIKAKVLRLGNIGKKIQKCSLKFKVKNFMVYYFQLIKK